MEVGEKNVAFLQIIRSHSKIISNILSTRAGKKLRRMIAPEVSSVEVVKQQHRFSNVTFYKQCGVYKTVLSFLINQLTNPVCTSYGAES